MQHLMSSLLAALVCGAVWPSSVAAQDADATREIASLERRTEAAILSRDTNYLAHYYAPDFRFKHSTGVTQDRSQWLASLAAGTYYTREVDSVDVEVHGDVALVTGRLHVRREPTSTSVAEYTIRYAKLYVRHGSSWQLASSHTMNQTTGPPSLRRHHDAAWLVPHRSATGFHQWSYGNVAGPGATVRAHGTPGRLR